MKKVHLLTTLFAITGFACGTTYERREPIGEAFPIVQGTSLDGSRYDIPRDFLGAPTLLLIGYEQRSQFDIDRWAMGLAQSGLSVRAVELPTIPGLVPDLLSGKIDSGMRSGIPQEDWSSVITIYGDAAKVAAFTGTKNPLPGRVVLLDAEGKVAFFHDRGYSVGSLKALGEVLRSLGHSEGVLSGDAGECPAMAGRAPRVIEL